MENAKLSPTRKCAVYTALKKFHGCHGDECNCKKYGKTLVEAKRAVDAAYDKQRRTPKQNKNWIEFPQLKEFASSLRNEVFKYDKNAFWDKEQFVKTQLAFILHFLIKYPIRRELATVKWNPKQEQWGTNDNYLDIKNHKIVLQKHKTSKHTGTHTYRLTRTMWRLWGLLRKQLNLRKIYKGHILNSKYYRPMSLNGFSSWMQREMKRCEACKGKCVSTMIIRHCCITHKRRHEMTNEKKREYAKDCLHSEQRNNLYRVHEDTK